MRTYVLGSLYGNINYLKQQAQFQTQWSNWEKCLIGEGVMGKWTNGEIKKLIYSNPLHNIIYIEYIAPKIHKYCFCILW